MFLRKPNELGKKIPSWKSKVLDQKREYSTRISYLKKISDNLDAKSELEFYSINSFEIFILFYEEFMHLESTLKAKGGLRTCAEYFKYLCKVMKTLMKSIEDKIRNGYNYFAIHFVVRKLIHPSNYPKVRRYGIELGLVWLHCLQEPFDIFSSSIVPLFISDLHPDFKKNWKFFPKDHFFEEKPETSLFFISNLDSQKSPYPLKLRYIFWEASLPYYPIPANEKIMVNNDKQLGIYLERILQFPIFYLMEISWNNYEMVEKSFNCIFTIFTCHLFAPLFLQPSLPVNCYFFCNDECLFFEPPNEVISDKLYPPTFNIAKLFIVNWIVSFFIKSNIDEKLPTRPPDESDINEAIKTSTVTLHTGPSIPPKSDLSDTDANIMFTNDIEVSGKSADETKGEAKKKALNLIQRVIFKSFNNMTLLFEIFRQTLLSQDKTTNAYRMAMLRLFDFWCETPNRPCCVTDHNVKPSPDKTCCSKIIDLDKECTINVFKFFRILFYLSLQPLYSNFNSAVEFVDTIPQLRNSLSYIRSFVTNRFHLIDNESWNKILEFLIDLFSHITRLNILISNSLQEEQQNRLSSFYSYFFQTVFLCWLRGNIYAIIPSSLWDKFTNILKNTRYIPEIYVEWFRSIEIITRIYCFDFFQMDSSEFPLDQEFDTRAKIKKIGQKILILNKSKHKLTCSFTSIPFSLDVNKNIPLDIIDQESKEKQPSPSFNIHTSAQIETDVKSEAAECSYSTADEKSTNWPDLLSNRDEKETATDVDTNKSEYSLISEKNQTYDESSTTSNSSLFKDKGSFKNVDSHSVPDLFFEAELLNEVKSSYQQIICNEGQSIDKLSETIAHSDPKIIEPHIINKESDASRKDQDLYPQFSDIPRDSSLYCNRERVFITWRRTLAMFGIIDQLMNPRVQFMCWQTYYKVFEKLENIAKNLGVDKNLRYIPPLDREQPLLHYFIPLAFQLLVRNDASQQVFLEAEKLALRSLLTPFNLAPTPIEYILIFLDIFSNILNQNNIDKISVFFQNASSIISSNIDGIYLLFRPILKSAKMLLSQTNNSSYETSVLLLSMCQHLFSFSSTLVDENSIDRYYLIDLLPDYMDVILMGCSLTTDSSSRCVYLCCLNQMVLENIISKKNINLVKFLITAIVKHLYCRSIIVVSFVCSILTSYVAFNQFFVSFDSCIFDDLCKYMINSQYSDKFISFNSLIFYINVLIDFIHKVPNRLNLKMTFQCIQSCHIKNGDFVNFLDSPNLYSFDEFKDISYSSFFENLVDLPSDFSSESNYNLKPDSPVPNSLNRNTNYEKMVQEREFSFYSQIQHLTDFCLFLMNNFSVPMGSDCLPCQVNESELLDGSDSISNCLLLCIRDKTIMSIFESKQKSFKSFGTDLGSNCDNSFICDSDQILIIVRTPLGKFSWVASELLRRNDDSFNLSSNNQLNKIRPKDYTLPTNIDPLRSLLKETVESYPELSLNYEFSKEKKTFSNFPKSSYVSQLLENLNIGSYPNTELSQLSNFDVCSLISPKKSTPSLKYSLFTQFCSQVGYFNAENRKDVVIIEPSERYFRDLKQIDSRFLRASHKIAVFYVKSGQEDKNSILNNNYTSKRFDLFLSCIGWVVDLENHTGFLGGLDKTYAKKCKTLYFCSPVNEVIFHVAPFMPSDESGDGQIFKLRHLGNDEVHIIWTEHYRPFRRGIINTEFGDVLIIIYPLKNGLFKIGIIKRPEIPLFGPLLDGSIVPFRLLSFLVRETAINASHCIRMIHNFYKTPYEDRLNVIQQLKEKHGCKQSFEQFMSSFISKHNKI